VGREHRREANRFEWVDGVQRLGNRARVEADELHCLLQADERVRKPVRRSADARRRLVGREDPAG
jgi:hypothetical protein